MGAIDRIVSGYNEATDAANYEEAIVLDEELISDDNYRVIWTTSYDGAYPPVK